tara:strand:+ start:1375 stop:1950 length:576 start_codon:yes stop_codon:yes gene_type:complete
MFLKNNFFLIITFLFLLSCQPIEIIKPIKIDYTKLDKISISAKEIIINSKYKSIFSNENIEDQIQNPPIKVINDWNYQNILSFGNENKLIINILDASIIKKEVNNDGAEKYEEKTVFKYKIFFLVEYELYDDSNFLIANTTVETSRSTTSKKYISLNETDIIINNLLHNALKDFIIETKTMMNIYMFEYIK